MDRLISADKLKAELSGGTNLHDLLAMLVDTQPSVDAVLINSDEWHEHYKNSYNQGFVDACKHYQKARDLIIENIKRVAKEEETEDINWSKGLNYALNIINKYF